VRRRRDVGTTRTNLPVNLTIGAFPGGPIGNLVGCRRIRLPGNPAFHLVLLAVTNASTIFTPARGQQRPDFNYMLLRTTTTNGTNTKSYSSQDRSPTRSRPRPDRRRSRTRDLGSDRIFSGRTTRRTVPTTSDAHRMRRFVISPWTKRGAVCTRATTSTPTAHRRDLAGLKAAVDQR